MNEKVIDNKKLIRKTFFGGAYNFESLEIYLSQMATQGLMFVKQKGFFYYFEKCEPRNIRFTVDFFDKASIFDTRPEKKTEEYIAFCEECGWHHLYTNGKIQFFYTEDKDAPPIQTDSSIKLKYIHKNVLQTKGPVWFLFPMFLLQIFMNGFFTIHSENFVDAYIVSPYNIILILFYSLFCIYLMIDILRYLCFYIPNKKRVKEGLAITYYSVNKNRKYNQFCVTFSAGMILLLLASAFSISIVTGICLLVFTILLCGMIWGVEIFRQGNQKLSRTGNIIINVILGFALFALITGFSASIVFSILGTFDKNAELITYYDEEENADIIQIIYHDDIPLSLEELGIDTSVAKYNQTNSDKYNSLFGTYNMYNQMLFDEDYLTSDLYTIHPSIRYEILDCKWDKIRQSYIDYTLAEYGEEYKDITDTEQALWQADTIYAIREENEDCGRLVIYEDKIILINSYWVDYSPEQITVMHNQLCE